MLSPERRQLKWDVRLPEETPRVTPGRVSGLTPGNVAAAPDEDDPVPGKARWLSLILQSVVMTLRKFQAMMLPRPQRVLMLREAQMMFIQYKFDQRRHMS